MPIAYGLGGTINVPQEAAKGKGAPPASFKGEFGQMYIDTTASDASAIYIYDGNSWVQNQISLSTDGTFATPSDSTASSSLAIKTYVDATASFGAPIATESTNGIGKTVTDANAIARIANSATEAYFVSPENLDAILASPSAIGGTSAAAGTFTALTANGSGAVSLTSNAAATLTNTSGDITIDSNAGSVIIDGGEAVADAILLDASNAAGGIDIDAGTGGITIDSGDAISIDAAAASNFTASAGDVTIQATTGSVNVNALENAAQAIYLHANGGTSETIQLHADQGTATNSVYLLSDVGGITLTATGSGDTNAIDINAPAGGVDVDAAGQVNIASGQNAASAVVIAASAGGIDITATGAAAEDLDLTCTNGSVNITAGETDAAAMTMQAASGGLDIDCALSIDIASSQAAATAIQMDASNAAGGITMAAGTGGILIGNQADCTTIDVGDLAPTASRTITIGGGTVVTASVTDLIDIAPDGATTNADSVKQVDILTGTVATGQSLLNLATGAITSGTHTVSIQSGNAAAGTVACNISTGTGTKTVNVGNADANTTINLDGVLAVNNNVNANVTINDGTSTGTVTVGSANAGAITVDSGSGISLDAASASNFNVTGATNDLTLGSAGGRVIVDAGEDAADAIYLHADAGTSETIRLHSDQGTGVDSIHLESDAGGVTLTSGLASADAINLSATAGGVDIDGALQVNIASSQASTGAVTLAASNASGSITHTGRCVFTPDSITSDNSGVAASVSTLLTLITTDGDSNLDNVTLADGQTGQVKMFAVVAAGNAADSVKITPANMAGGTQITFAADPTGLGCTMCFDGTNWTVVANNGGTIA